MLDIKLVSTDLLLQCTVVGTPIRENQSVSSLFSMHADMTDESGCSVPHAVLLFSYWLCNAEEFSEA